MHNLLKIKYHECIFDVLYFENWLKTSPLRIWQLNLLTFQIKDFHDKEIVSIAKFFSPIMLGIHLIKTSFEGKSAATTLSFKLFKVLLKSSFSSALSARMLILIFYDQNKKVECIWGTFCFSVFNFFCFTVLIWFAFWM